MRRKIISIILFLMMVFSLTPQNVHAETEEIRTNAEFIFSDSGIDVEKSGQGYTISDTVLSISAPGVYRIGGSCNAGNIVVEKGLSGVTLILDDLRLTSETGAPLVIKKNTTANIHLDGTSTLTDGENAADEDSTDSSIADAFEGAAVKIKSGSKVTFCGEGNLNVVANAKNGIKGGSEATIIFNQSGTVTVSGSGKYYGSSKTGAAVNNGIACDGSLVFNRGTYMIKAANDGIKSAPDATNAEEGTTIDKASAGTVTINGGSFDIDVDGDGIQADSALNIGDGTFNISTYKGYATWNDTLADQLSCKGLKAAGDRAEEAGIKPQITISGGSFVIDSGDDAIHSDAYATVTGGSFSIKTGDDGLHADTSLILGTEGSSVARDPDVKIENSYEGLEGGTVYIYSGRYYVVASDDGVNAAGGSSNGYDPGNPWGDGFNPGGDRPGNPWNTSGDDINTQTSADEYNIYIYGGNLYVNCNGDGLDSNGGLYLTGGTQEVFSQSNGDNSAIDADGTISIAGATIFTAGANPQMNPVRNNWFGSEQKYTTYSSNFNSGTVINAISDTVLYSTKIPKTANFFMYSAPLSSTPSIQKANSLISCQGGSWSHSWDNGLKTPATSSSEGLITYTCAICGKTETQTIPMAGSMTACTHLSEEDPDVPDNPGNTGYTVTFAGDAGVKEIDVYYSQDYSNASETVESTGITLSRDGDTGKPLSDGNGQVNFRIVLNDGYSLSAVNATEGTFKNIKGPSDTGEANTYRITKVSGDMVITITTETNTSTDSTEGTEDPASSTDQTGSDTEKTNDSTVSDSASGTEKTGKMGSDGTAYGKGASYEVVNKSIASLKNDKDPKGTKYAPIRLRSPKQTNKSIKLTWQKISGASRYIVYGNQCGKSKRFKKIQSVKKQSLVIRKTASGKIRKGKYYKFILVALDNNNNVISTSKIVHVASRGGKAGNYKKLTIKAKINKAGKTIKTYKNLTGTVLKKGKTVKLAVTGIKQTRNTKVSSHRKICYESTDTNVATVSSGGKVTARSKGSCYIWAYAQNGAGKRIKITVK